MELLLRFFLGSVGGYLLGMVAARVTAGRSKSGDGFLILGGITALLIAVFWPAAVILLTEGP